MTDSPKKGKGLRTCVSHKTGPKGKKRCAKFSK